MLSPAIWLEAAERANMKPGQHRRFGHDCGSGEVVQVWCESDGISGYCFRCSDSYKQFIKPSFADLVENLRARREVEASLYREVKLPDDCTSHMPPEARLWLAKAGIRPKEIEAYEISYSPKMQRVVIPVYAAGALVAIQARWLGKEGNSAPKYLNFGPRDVFASLACCLDSKPKIGEPTFVVFTEDILSSIRVGRVAPSYALTGTSVPLSRIARAISGHETCVLWLDGDRAGVKGTSKLRKHLGLLTDDVRSISSQRDPKEYPDRLIRKYLQEVMKDGIRNYCTPISEVPGSILPAPLRY